MRRNVDGAGDTDSPVLLDERVAPDDMAEVTHPETAMTGLPSPMACRTLTRVPQSGAASTTTVPEARAAMIRFLSRNARQVGGVDWLRAFFPFTTHLAKLRSRLRRR